MELAPSGEPWTAVVAWARPWHRPAPGRTAPAAGRVAPKPAAVGPPEGQSALAQEAAFAEAVAGLRAARQALERLPRDVEDPWLEALARQELFRARRRVREAQEALTGNADGLHWSL